MLEYRAIKLCLGPLAVLIATSAQANVDCIKLNSPSAIQSIAWEDLTACLEGNPSIIGTQDGNGLNLVSTALKANIDPFMLYYLLSYVQEQDWHTVFEAKDHKNRSFGHIVADEVKDPSTVFVLTSYGISMMEEQDSKGGWLDFGSSPLHLAAARADGWPILAALLATGNEQFPDQNNRTPLDVALSKPETAMNALLLADGRWPEIYRTTFETDAPATATDCSMFLTTEFFSAATEAQVVACVTGGAKLDSVDSDGNSALHLAAQASNDPWIIDYFLSQTADPQAMLTARNSKGMTALHLAASFSPSPDTVAHLIAWGADPDERSNGSDTWFSADRDTTPLHMAARREDDLREAVLLNLLAFGADTMAKTPVDDEKSGGGRTALHLASLRPNPRVELMLLEAQYHQQSLVGDMVRGFQGRMVKEITDDQGRTALHIVASKNGDWESVGLLLDYGFSVDTKDDEGSTPLMFAARYLEDAELFSLMLDQSEDACASSSAGATIESAVRQNPKLNTEQTDLSGKTISTLAKIKKLCP